MVTVTIYVGSSCFMRVSDELASALEGIEKCENPFGSQEAVAMDLLYERRAR